MPQLAKSTNDTIDSDERRPQRWTPGKLALFIGGDVSARWARDRMAEMARAGALHKVGRFYVGSLANVRRFFLGELPACRRKAS